MKTKTIFKTVALAMLMPTMLLTTACSSEDDALNNTANTENTINKGYALPVTVNVTRGDGATRATYTDNGDGTGSLAFSAGDKLFVYGSATAAGSFAGTLNYVPATGNFSGTIYTQNSYEGDFETLFTAATEDHNIEADLLPAGYEDYEFLSIVNSGYEAQLGIAFSNAFATSTAVKTAKALAVEQFSCELSYAYDNGFALSPDYAILNFTITGLSASTDVDVTFTGTAQNITNSVTTDADGKATFAIGINTYYDLTDYSLTVGGNAITITSTSKTPVAGKIYNISRSAASVPAGAINGKFTINADGDQVYFSKGNLQATYNGSTSTWTWAFAEHQYDYIGNASGNTMVTDSDPFISENATVDLFGWVGASSTWDGVNKFGITSAAGYDYLNTTDGYGNGSDEILKSDWGTNIGTGWRTLTSDEWNYIFTRTTGGTVGSTAQACYTMATINTDATSVNGIILFPDGVDFADTEFTTLGTVNSASDWGTECTTAQWTALAAKGCVFLPAAGYRDEAVVEVADDGYYWSSSANGDEDAHYMYFRSGELPEDTYTSRYNGHSVRLVRPVQ